MRRDDSTGRRIVSTRSLRNCAVVHDHQHDVLGIVGEYHETNSGYAFQLYYWDYVIGIVLGSLGWGVTLGNWGGGNLSFFSNISQADSRHILFAIAGGACF